MKGYLRTIRTVITVALAASSEELLKKGQGDLWDGGKVESCQKVCLYGWIFSNWKRERG